MFGIRLKGKPSVKCDACHGGGLVYQNNIIRTCRNCEGKGVIDRVKLAERALDHFKQPRIYKISHEHSTVLLYRGYVYNEVLTALRVLTVSGIKAQLIFHI